jgi:hypothetical protein
MQENKLSRKYIAPVFCKKMLRIVKFTTSAFKSNTVKNE